MSRHVHGEAFNLMVYVSDDGQTGELIWNSRDGVTPFIVHSRDGVEMTHVDWQSDVYAPRFRPPPGMRIFVDMTQEMAMKAALERVEDWWDHPDYPMHKRYSSKGEAAAALAVDYYGDGHNPTIIEAPARPARKKGPFG